MEKKVQVKSADGKTTVNGKIVVSINYTKKKETVHNRGTHDEEERMVSYSKVEAFREGDDKPLHSIETKGENNLIGHVKSMEERLLESLRTEADRKKELTTADKLELLGYV